MGDLLWRYMAKVGVLRRRGVLVVVGRKLFPIPEQQFVHQAGAIIKLFKFPWEYSMENYKKLKTKLRVYAILCYENKII